MDREAKLALAKKKLQEFQANKLKTSETVENFVDLYKESSIIIDSDTIQKAEEDWIDNWVKKVNSLKRTDEATTSVSLKPVLTALGVSMNIVDALEFNNAADMQVSPVKLEDMGLPVIPKVEYKSDPIEYQNELLNKTKILTESLEKLKKSYLEETSKRKVMEHSVAQITSSIVTGLEKVEEEKTRFKSLLEESHTEKNKLKSELQDLLKKNQELTEEINQKQSQAVSVPNTSDMELKLQQVMQELFTAKKTNEGLQHTLDVKQAEWIRKEKDFEDSNQSVEMEKAALAVLKVQVENMKFSAEEELQKALDMNKELIEIQNQLNEEKKELENRTEYLSDAQRILNQRVEKMDQMSQAKDLTLQNQISEQKEALDNLRKKLEEEKDEIIKDRALLREKEKLFFALEEKEDSMAKREASLFAKETRLADKESDMWKRENMIVEKETLILRQIKENEANKPTTSMEKEMKIRQEELTKSIKSFNDFKDQLEASMKEREGKYNQKIQNLENEKFEANKKYAEEKKDWEIKIKKLEDQIIFAPKSKKKVDSSAPTTDADRNALEQEISIISEIKTRSEQDSEFIKAEKARIMEEANQLEREWMAVRLKEAEITKAMADISVAAAQQAVGSSISTAETLISRDQIRELQQENRELIKENENLKIKMVDKNGKEKIQPVAISPLFKSDIKGVENVESPVLSEVSPDLSHVIFNLMQSNQDLKNRIEYLVKAFEEKASPTSHLTGITEELHNVQSRPSSRMNDRFIRRMHKPIADPRIIQSALGNPIAVAYPTSPDLGTSVHQRPQIIPSLKNSPPRPLSTEFFRRVESSQSNYSVPAERKDVVKELDAQISAQINELNEIFGESSFKNPLITDEKRGESDSPTKIAGSLTESEKERIRSIVKQRIREKKSLSNKG